MSIFGNFAMTGNNRGGHETLPVISSEGWSL
jgi:hypothetical protein